MTKATEGQYSAASGAAIPADPAGLSQIEAEIYLGRLMGRFIHQVSVANKHALYALEEHERHRAAADEMRAIIAKYRRAMGIPQMEVPTIDCHLVNLAMGTRSFDEGEIVKRGDA